MESKYKERAITILKEIANIHSNSSYNTIYGKWEALSAMCKLAEEVEYTTNERWVNSIKDGLYTKQQVEETLEKQREVSATCARTNNMYTTEQRNSLTRIEALEAELMKLKEDIKN